MPPGSEPKDADGPREGRRAHEIMASNFFMGVVRFVRLELPPWWRLGAGRMVPEVERTREFGGEIWVAEGNSTHVMYDEKALRACELQIHVADGGAEAEGPRGVPQLRQAQAGGHPARVYQGQVQEGLVRRRPVPLVAVAFACPQTGRHLRLEVRGNLDDRELDLFLRALEHLVCH